jgi:hypothetical protein
MKLAASPVESNKRLRWSGTSTAALVIFNFGICYFRSFAFPIIPLMPWGDAVGFLNNGGYIDLRFSGALLVWR